MILITGSDGQLGYDVIRELKKRKIDCIGSVRSDFELTDYEETEKYILKIKPDCIIHCAAYTNVNKAENEKELCYKVNVNGTENIAKVCRKLDAKMIYISTDYIFDGTKDGEYEVDDIPNPLSVYGKTKYEGELKVKENIDKYFIVRTSWVFGSHGNNFVKTMLKLAKEKESIDVVCDQIGSPTYTVDLARLLCDMMLSDKYGTYNVSNEGFCSWFEFAEQIMKVSRLECKIKPIITNKYSRNVIRPFNSKMSKKSLVENGFKLLPDWKNAIHIYIEKNNYLNDIFRS